MATLNPQILLSQQQIKPPNTDLTDTFTQIARMRAYQQSQRLEELKYGQLERTAAKDAAFDQLAAGLFTAPQAQPAAASQRGLAAGPPQTAAAPQAAGQQPGPWAGGYVAPDAAPGASFAMAQPGMPPSMPGMPPGIPAPTSMEPGQFTMAQGTPPPAPPVAPRSLADVPPGGMPPAAQEPPQGLGGAQPGAPKSLLQPVNEDVLMRLYAANPERASKLMEGHLKMQTGKLEQAEKMNDQIYQVLSAVERSPDPAAMYPEAIKSLKERGIPIPDSFPKQYNPALVRFKLQEHETLKSRLEAAKIDHENQKTLTARADELYKGAQAQREGTQSKLDVATTGLREAETKRVPAQQAEDEARTAQLRQQTSDLVQARKDKAGQVTPYTTDPDQNVYLSQAAQELKLPLGTPPTKEVIDLARRYQVEDKQSVVRKTGLDAAAKVLPAADAKRVEALSAKGTAMEGLQNTLDEVERLIKEGVYTNIPEDRLKNILADAGLRANDPIAARTARLYELGNAMTIEHAGGSLGGHISDTDLKTYQSAGGNFQRPKSALAMQESLKSIRNLAKVHLQDANSGWKRYKETNTLPRFGEARAERLKLLTPDMLEDAYEARKKDGWTKEQLRKGFLDQGWREE